MLPSRGLFKEEPCPLFEISDCNRPHCHFRHKKSDANNDFTDCFASLEKALDKIPIQWGHSRQPYKNSKTEEYVNCDATSTVVSVVQTRVSKEPTNVSSRDAIANHESKTISEEKVSINSENLNVSIPSNNENGASNHKVCDTLLTKCDRNVNLKVNLSSEKSNDNVLSKSQLVSGSEVISEENIKLENINLENVKDDIANCLEGMQTKESAITDVDDGIASEEQPNINASCEKEIPSTLEQLQNLTTDNKLTKEHLRGIDEIVRLLKKVPERIDFVASFLKTFVKTEEKSKVNATTSSTSSHKKSRSHSSRSHKSSRSSHSSERKHKNDRHRDSSKSDRREHSKSNNHSTEKRRRKSDIVNGDVPAKKMLRCESSPEKLTLPTRGSSIEEENDSEDGLEIVLDFDDNVDSKEAEEPPAHRLSLEEELERLHDSPTDEVPASQPGASKRRIAHGTPYISDHKMLRAKVGKSSPALRPPDRVTTVAPAEPAHDSSRAASLLGLNVNRPRIVAVPYAHRMLAEKSNITSSAGRSSLLTSTTAKSVAPGSKRVEHRSDNPDVLCPVVSAGSRTIPPAVRNLTLKRLYTALQYYPSKNEAKDEALIAESKIFEEHKDSSKKYHMASVNAIMKAKRGFVKEKPSGPSELEFFERVKNFTLSEEEIAKNGFPVEIEKGYARCILSEDFKYNRKYRYIKEAFAKGERYCIRCSMTYRVNEETWEQTPVPDVCVFHSDSGKKRVLGEVTHKCCSTPGKGCMSESLHITDLKDYERLPDCVKSEPKFPVEKYRRVLALDCEMVHTRLGVELAYVVVVDSSCTVVYESYCKPSHEVECYNTAYSGMTEEKLRNVTKTLKTIQREILDLISDETILVGHSLDSDMRALHIIHNVIADTAFLYRVESPDGSFYKRRLKELAQTYLGKIIQESEYGHCAEEDASAAMALLRHRVLSM